MNPACTAFALAMVLSASAGLAEDSVDPVLTAAQQPGAKHEPPPKHEPSPKHDALAPKRDASPSARHGAGAPAKIGGRRGCLSATETRDAVAARKLFPPFSALRIAGAHARGETIGVRLCRRNEELMYEINVLRRDGRVVKVILDAATGKILRSINDR